MTTARVSQIAKWLDLFLAPDQVTECRAIYGDKQVACSFHKGNLDLARRAVELDEINSSKFGKLPVGIYFTPNTLRPDLITARKSCTKADVIQRDWLLLDFDPVRPAGESSSEGERSASWDCLQRVLGWCEAAGFTSPIIADSGNGFHLCYPIAFPADDAAQQLIKSILQGLHKRCSDDYARVDVATHDAPRIWKLYGTRSRKGEANSERPHRYSRIVSGDKPTNEQRTQNNAAMRRLLEIWTFQERVKSNKPDHVLSEHELISLRIKSYLAKEPAAIAGQGGHNQAYHVAMILVEGFGVNTESDFLSLIRDWNASCVPPWSEEELRHKFESAMKNCDTSKRGYLLDENRNGFAGPSEAATGQQEEQKETKSEDATLADLIEINATVRWVWPGWIQLGVLTGLAAEPGTGKTRLCMDLARRLAKGMPWPDGTENTFPPESRTLWMPADNQHAELATIAEQYGLSPNLVFLNAPKGDPFGGTNLDTDPDRRALEKRIARIKPALVIIDTILATTDKTAYSPEDAKALFKPLQEIAQRQQTAIVCVTHTNKGGQALGRRIMGQCRVVIQMSHPDKGQENRRRFWVEKSNSLMPPPLGITMNTEGNEYDNEPPQAPEEGPAKTGPSPARLQECADWLVQYLEDGPKRVSTTRTEAEFKGFDAKLLYRAKKHLEVDEYETEGKKWWQLMA